MVAIDVSHSMMSMGKWEGISVIKWDIGDSLFSEGLFDRVLARMVFHHILDNLDRAILRCYDVLKKGGKIVVAEGVPPTDDQEVVEWYTNMFKLKEKRRTFSIGILESYLKKNGFKDIQTHVHVMKKFSINNWLDNSGISREKQKKIYSLHVNASKKVKDAYNMKIIKNECFVRTVNLIVKGKK